MDWPFKDPQEILDYSVDWSNLIAPDDSVQGYDFAITSGDVVIDQMARIENVTTVWLSGGTTSVGSSILCKMNTVNGRQFERTVKIKIKEK